MSQTVDEVVATLGEGDIIKTTRTHKVYSVLDNGVGTEDALTGVRFWIGTGIDHGSLKVELVKKAKPKVKVGDVISGKLLKEIPWKRGTVIKATRFVYVLTSDGEWFSPGDGWSRDDSFTFDQLSVHHSIEVIYLP